MEEGLSNIFQGNIALPTGTNIVFEDSLMAQGVLNPSPAVGEIYKDLGYVFAVRPLIYSRPSLASINIVGDWVCKSGIESFQGLTRYQLLYELCVQMGWIFFFNLEDDMIIEGQAIMKLHIMNRANVPEEVDDIDYTLALKWTIKSSLEVRFIDTLVMEESELACTNRGYGISGSNDNESPSLNGMSYIIAANNFRLGWHTPLPYAKPTNDVNWAYIETQPTGNNPMLFHVIYHDGIYPWDSVTRIQRIVWERDRFITFRSYYYTWSGGVSGEAVLNHYDNSYETDSMLRLDFNKSDWAKVNIMNTIYTDTVGGVWRGNSYGTTNLDYHYIYRGTVANSFIRIGIKRTSSTTDAYTAIQHYGQYVKTATFQNNFQKFVQNLNTKIFEIDLQDIDLNFVHKKRILNYPYDSGEATYRVTKQKLNLEEGITTLTIQKIDEDA